MNIDISLLFLSLLLLFGVLSVYLLYKKKKERAKALRFLDHPLSDVLVLFVGEDRETLLNIFGC